MIIGVMGQKGSGKDTVGAYLAQQYAFERIAFADKLKEMVRVLYGVEYKNVNKEEFLSKLGMTRRELWQNVGVMLRGVYEDTWVHAAFHSTDLSHNYVVTDVRFLNEVAYIRNLPVDSFLLRLDRGGLEDADAHVSEHEWRGAPFDFMVPNDRSLDALYGRLDGIMSDLGVMRAALI